MLGLGFVSSKKEKQEAVSKAVDSEVNDAREKVKSILGQRAAIEHEILQLGRLRRNKETRMIEIEQETRNVTDLRVNHHIKRELDRTLDDKTPEFDARLRQLAQELADCHAIVQRLPAQQSTLTRRLQDIDSPLRLAKEALHRAVRDYLGKQFEPDFREKLIRFWAGAGLVRNGVHLETCLLELLGLGRHAADEEVRLKKIALIDEFKVL